VIVFKKNPNILSEIAHYLKIYRKWWLLPVILATVLFVVLLLVAEGAPLVSPFIYTLF